MEFEIKPFWVVGAGGLNNKSPVMISRNWPPDLCASPADAKQFGSVEAAEEMVGQARAHPLGRTSAWVVYRVETDDKFYVEGT